MTTHHATCCCGQLRVTCDGDPIRVSMCHCRACQRRTGSVVGVQARFSRDRVTVEGRATRYERVGDAGARIASHFCPDCGSTLYWEMDVMEGCVAVAVGAFADAGFPPPTFSVYEARRHPWLDTTSLDIERMD